MTKTSKYNFTVEAEDGSLLLYNTRTGAFAAIEPDKKEAVLDLLRHTAAADKEGLASSLEQGGFLVPEEMNEIDQVKRRFNHFRTGTKSMTLTMLASENCNFRCPYCFIYDRRGMAMAPSVYEGVLQLIEKNITPGLNLTVNWFGGEPTLEYRNIILFMNRLNGLFARHPAAKFNSGMVTNGYLLTGGAFRDYLSSGIKKFQVTIDGVEESHNKTRVLRNGQGTFKRIWGNLKNIKENVKPEDDFKLLIRVNFLKGQDKQVSSLIDLFRETFKSDPRFTIYFRAVYNIQTSRDDISGINDSIYPPLAGVEKQLDYHLLSAEKTGSLHNNLQMAAPVPSPIPGWCAAQRANSWTVGADGLLFKCDTYSGDISKACGRLLPDGGMERFDVRHEWDENIYDRSGGKCVECRFLPVCQGGCPRGRAARLKQGICYFSEEIINKGMLATHAHHQKMTAVPKG